MQNWIRPTRPDGTKFLVNLDHVHTIRPARGSETPGAVLIGPAGETPVMETEEAIAEAMGHTTRPETPQIEDPKPPTLPSDPESGAGRALNAETEAAHVDDPAMQPPANAPTDPALDPNSPTGEHSA